VSKDTLIVVVDGNGEGLFRILLTYDILIEHGMDLFWRIECQRLLDTVLIFENIVIKDIFLTKEDLIGGYHTVGADIGILSCDQWILFGFCG